MRTDLRIACDRCGIDAPDMPDVLRWLISDEAGGGVPAVCPACQTLAERGLVAAAHEGLRWIHDNAGVGGPGTMFLDYVSCVGDQLVRRRHRRGDHSRCYADDGCRSAGARVLPPG